MRSFGGFLLRCFLVAAPLGDAFEAVDSLDLIVESSSDQPLAVSTVEVLEV
jgi:hypothetical protein